MSGWTDSGREQTIKLLFGEDTEIAQYGGFGVDNTDTPQETSLQSTIKLIHECDAITGWTAGGDAVTPTLESTNYKHGTGAVNLGLTYSSGSGYYDTSFTAIDLSGDNDKVYLFVYIDDPTLLTSGEDTISVLLGTGGFTNANKYDFASTTLGVGWNGLIVYVYDEDSQLGSGATLSSVDNLRLKFKSGNTITVGNLKVDYVRAVVDGGLGLSDSYATFTYSNNGTDAKVTYKALSTECNGYDLSTPGISGSTILFTKTQHTAVNKTEDIELQADEFIKVI